MRCAFLRKKRRPVTQSRPYNSKSADKTPTIDLGLAFVADIREL